MSISGLCCDRMDVDMHFSLLGSRSEEVKLMSIRPEAQSLNICQCDTHEHAPLSRTGVESQLPLVGWLKAVPLPNKHDGFEFRV